MLLATTPSALWYLARGSGLVLLGLLSANLILGIAIHGGWRPQGWPRFAVQGLHRNLALLAGLLLLIHVVTIELDPFVPVGWWAVAVPFVSPYRSLWLGLGTLSVDILVAVVLTSLIRGRLRPGWWRAIHWLGYLAWPVAVLHSLGTGTDTRLSWVFVLEMAMVGAVVVAIMFRLARSQRPGTLQRAALMIGAAFTPVAVLAFAASGPLQSGWAKRAGTPTSLLASGSNRGPGGSSSPGARPGLAAFTAPFQGTLTEVTGASSEQITISGQVVGGGAGTFTATLSGQPLSQGGISVAAGNSAYVPAGNLGRYSGSLTAISGGVLQFRLQGPSGTTVPVALVLRSEGQGGQVSGYLYFDTTPPTYSSGGDD